MRGSTPRWRGGVDHVRNATIRPIERSDASALSALYAHLSSESRRRRFLGSSPASRVLGRGLAVPGEGFVAELAGEIVGHASIDRDERDGAEIAFVVADELQGRGIGRALVAAALEHAGRIGLRSVTAMLCADNAQMRRLLACADYPVSSDVIDAGVEEITLGVASV